MVVRDGDRASGRETASRLPPRRPTVVRHEQRRLSADDRDDPRAERVGGDEQRQLDAFDRRAEGAIRRARGSRARPLRGRSSRCRTTSRRVLADRRSRRALAFVEHLADDECFPQPTASTGGAPSWRADRYATMNASPAPVASTSATGVAGTCVTSPSTHTSAPREPNVTRTSATPSPRAVVWSKRPRATILASSSESLSIETCASSVGSKLPSCASGPSSGTRTSPCPSNATRLPPVASAASVSGGKSLRRRGATWTIATSGSRWAASAAVHESPISVTAVRRMSPA